MTAPGAFVDCERDVTLTIHFTTFGTEEQARIASARQLRNLEVHGVNIIHAMHNGEAIEPAEPGR